MTAGRPRLAGVFAHPDDDVYLMGGSLALHAGEVDVAVVFATSGGNGPIWNDALATRETLAEVREREARAANEAVGADPALHFLRYTDYYLNEVPREELVSRIAERLVEAAPHVVVTFGPDGMTSHHDHIAAGAAATEAFHRARATASDGAFRRLYHAAHRRSDIDRFYAGIGELMPDFGGPGVLFNPVGVPDDSIAVAVDTTPVRETKLEGILRHGTQVGELERIPESLRWIYLDRECFVQAWPPRESSSAVLGDLFEGVHS